MYTLKENIIKRKKNIELHKDIKYLLDIFLTNEIETIKKIILKIYEYRDFNSFI